MQRVAIVGAGRMGRIRALAARELGASVVSISDPLADRARALASEVGATVTDQPDLGELDALFLCTPPADRGLAVAAVEAGVRLLVEKPLALSAEDAAPLIAALARRPIPTAVGYMNRYRPSVERARTAVSGQLMGIVGRWVCGRYGVPWWGDPARSGGPFNEQLTHLVDLCRYLGGEIREVQAMTEGSGTAALTLRLDNGAPCALCYSCTCCDFPLSTWRFCDIRRTCC